MIKKKIAKRPPRITIYGVPKVGKSTLAAHAPSPVFIACEDGCRELTPQPAVWTFDDKERIQPKTLDEFRDAVQKITKDPQGCKTLVVDGISDLDRLVQQHLCARNPKWGGDITYLGYGRPEALILGTWRELLVDLEAANNSGLGVILLGHHKVEKFSPPDSPEFTRYQLAVTSHKQGDVAGMLLAWSDIFGFARFVQMTMESGKRLIGSGVQGARVLHIQRTDSHDAGSRYKNAPAQIPMSWTELERVMNAGDLNPEDLRAQIDALIPQLPADKREATSKWLSTNLTVDDLVLGLDRIRGAVLLTGS